MAFLFTFSMKQSNYYYSIFKLYSTLHFISLTSKKFQFHAHSLSNSFFLLLIFICYSFTIFYMRNKFNKIKLVLVLYTYYIQQAYTYTQTKQPLLKIAHWILKCKLFDFFSFNYRNMWHWIFNSNITPFNSLTCLFEMLYSGLKTLMLYHVYKVT